MFDFEEQQEDGDLATVVRLIKEIRIALCTSVDQEGMPHARPVQTLAAEGDGSLWFFTDWHSDKVAELRRDDRVIRRSLQEHLCHGQWTGASLQGPGTRA
jgi:general stress protein 26